MAVGPPLALARSAPHPLRLGELAGGRCPSDAAPRSPRVPSPTAGWPPRSALARRTDREMDVGDYETNTFAVTGIASVSFRVYRPAAAPAAAAFACSVSEVEQALRSDGHLVFTDAHRQAIWCFRLLHKDGSCIGSAPRSELRASIDVGRCRLAMVEEGALDPGSLARGRPVVANAINTPNSSSSSSALSAADSAPRSTVSALPPSALGLAAPAAVNAAASSSSQATTASGSTPDVDAAAAHAPYGHAAGEAQAPGSGIPDAGRAFPPVPAKVVYNFLVAAVLASLSAAYCSKTKAIALNHRTFLLPPLDPLWDGEEQSRTDSRSLVATLRVSLTTAGALLVSLSHSILRGMGCSEWACYAGVPPPGSPVLAAPWGKFATVLDVHPPLPPADASDASGLALGPPRRSTAPHAVPPAWKSFAARMLEMRGTSAAVLDETAWLRVECLLDEDAPDGPTVELLWPSVLCFWNLERPALAAASPFQRLDPLANVREAFLDASRAEEAALRGRDEARAAEDVAMEDAQTVSSLDKGPFSDGPSPLGMRHPLGAAAAAAAPAAGAVYPTPPDGILNPVGATPTFDGSASSPGNVAGAAAPANLDMPAADPVGAEDAFGDFWPPSHEPRSDEADPGFIGEPDSLFGDLGADIFGGDVTDADFNFFDDKQADGGHPPGDAAGAADPGRMEVDTGGGPGATPDGGRQPEMGAAPQPAGGAEAAADEPSPSGEHAPGGPVGPGEAVEKRPGSPVFAKPELKHARSHLADASAGGMKRPPSPFNAMTVYKRVRALAEANRALPIAARQVLPAPPLPARALGLGRRRKRFEGLRLTDFMIQNNKKYERNGKFSFRWPHPESDMLSDASSATSPTAFRRPAKKRPELSDASPEFASLVSSITRGLKSSSLYPASPLPIEDSGDTSSNSTSFGSSSDEESDEDEPLAASMAQRRLRTRDEPGAFPSPEVAAELSRAYSEGVWDFPIARFFAEPMTPPAELNYADEDIVDVAQILTQQITHATIRAAFDEDDSQNLQQAKLRHTLLQRIRYSVATLQDALPAPLDGAVRCSLKPYLEIQDIPLLMPPSRLQPRPPPGSEQLRTNLFPVPTPLVGIRRNETALSILPTAIEFWEVLGLDPLHGTKDIRAVCLYPDYEGLADGVGQFLSRMRIVYESLRLGSHELLSAKTNVVNGMVAFDAGISSATTAAAPPPPPRGGFSGADQVHKLAQALAAEDTPDKSLVVYVVYCAAAPTAMIDACLAFQRLSQLYEMAVAGRNSEPNDLVLQLLPSSFLASPTSLAMPTPRDMLCLSLEVYDRCASPRGPRPAPAFLLEQPPTRMLDLKLSPTPSIDVQRENSMIHVAYAVSADGRWVTAAWTDNSGWRQFSAAYWMGRKDAGAAGGGGGGGNAFAAAAQEIWTNTCAIVSNLKVHWRAVVAKCSPMEQEEVDVWLELAKAETRASISLTLVTVDAQPALELLPPVATVSPAVLSQISAAATAATPAPTPQASVFSPEQSGNPATPATPVGGGGAPTPATPGGAAAAAAAAAPNSPAAAAGLGSAASEAAAKLAAAGADPCAVADIDGNVVLVDITDNTWVAVAAHRLNTAPTWVDLRYALVSGYLIKRGGIVRDDAPVVLEVNVLRAEGGPRGYEALVREVLTAYRSLGTLGRARGILDGERDARPWHVAAAERSARALCRWM